MHVAAVGAVEAVVGGGVEVGRRVPAEGDGAAEPLEAGGEGEGEGLRRVGRRVGGTATRIDDFPVEARAGSGRRFGSAPPTRLRRIVASSLVSL